MYTIKVRNVNELFGKGILMLAEHGRFQPSQHGDTLEMDEPVSVMYTDPRERVLFDAARDSNPFLNLFEALWILAGREDVKFLQELVGRMATYSDNGKEYFGAYGARMRGTSYALDRDASNGDTCDQIETAIARLRDNPNDRQVVLTIRQPSDMLYRGKDQPCNLMAALKVRDGRLNIHVFNRSNDFVWGLAGTNVVQFSMLQEYIAGRIGVQVGMYHQTTDSMHAYINEQWTNLYQNAFKGEELDLYNGVTQPFDMMESPEGFDHDLTLFFHQYDRNSGMGITRLEYQSKFFQDLVFPAWYAFMAYKDFRDTGRVGALEGARNIAEQIPADWGVAIRGWLSRRGGAK